MVFDDRDVQGSREIEGGSVSVFTMNGKVYQVP